MDGVIDAVRGRIDVNRIGSTYILEIQARSADPQTASKLANTLADVYLVNQLDTRRRADRHNAKVRHGDLFARLDRPGRDEDRSTVRHRR